MIGYYAHSHGIGHSTYANLFYKSAPDTTCIFTDSRYPFATTDDVVLLDNENPDGTQLDRDIYLEPDHLHYAPVGMSKITNRNRRILQGVLERGVRLMIIDVSVEMASLMRVSSVPYAYVRLMGKRDDLAHLGAYQGALFLLAYFPKELESANTPEWIVDKTVYLGFLTDKKNVSADGIPKVPSNYALYMQGFGGQDDCPDLMERIARHIYPRTLVTIGPTQPTAPISNRIDYGRVTNVHPFISGCDFVLASCGMNTVTEILMHRKKYLMYPQKRPYREQFYMAKSLEAIGAGVILDMDTIEGSISKLERQTIFHYPDWVGTESLYRFLGFLGNFDYRPCDFMKPLFQQDFQYASKAVSNHRSLVPNPQEWKVQA